MTNISSSTQMNSLEHMIREQLKLPVSNLILSTIIEISQEIPDNPNSLSPSNAQYLAGRFLKGMDLCGELYAIAVGYELKQEVLKKREHGFAFTVRSKNKGFKTAKEKEAYANTDDEYLAAADKYAEARMFRIRVEAMRKDFEKAHYLMRKIADEDSVLPNNGHSNQDSQDSETENSWGAWSVSNDRKPW